LRSTKSFISERADGREGNVGIREPDGSVTLMATSAYVSWFSALGLADRPVVGGKGASLGELGRAGIAVPPGFVVRTAAFERFLDGARARVAGARARRSAAGR
jgi:hypothetical protein